jgi:hypothetical protein
MKLLPESRIPSFEVEATTRESQAPEDATSDAGGEDDEVAMEEPTTRNKGKWRADVVLVSAPKRTGAATKRVFPESPTKVGPPKAKRVRVVKVATQEEPELVEEGKEIAKPKGLDLSGYGVEELDWVTEGQVPEAKGKVRSVFAVLELFLIRSAQVCDHCKLRNKACRPVWGFLHQEKAIRCRPCVKGKKGCSFSSYKWKIAVWPNIEKSSEENQRRAAATAAKHKAPGAKVQKTGPAKKTRTRKQAASSQTISIASTPDPVERSLDLASAPAKTAASQVSQVGTITPRSGFHESVFLENLRHYDELLGSSGVTVSELGMAIAHLEGLKVREAGEQEAIRVKLARREKLVDGLVARLETAIALRQPAANAEAGPSRNRARDLGLEEEDEEGGDGEGAGDVEGMEQ